MWYPHIDMVIYKTWRDYVLLHGFIIRSIAITDYLQTLYVFLCL
jgi:hypothetical protein